MGDFPRIEELKSKLKILHSKPKDMEQPTYDLLIDLTTDKMIEEVAAFINAPVEEIPKGLDSAMLMRLSSWFTDSGVLVSSNDRLTGSVKSVTEGDGSVSWNTPAWALTKLSDTLLINDELTRTLVKYRRMAGWGGERGERSYGTNS